MNNDRRLIEDYLPIVAISAEASREKSVRKGHISTLHLWWARRPLVACRAAVYGALVPAARFVPNGATEEKKKSLGRANAAKFMERLCKYPGSPAVIAEAQRHILEAHAERLTGETGKKVTVEDIVEGRAPRPKVLDMFAGGGAIPLEALRLGCDAYALDLNPVAHIIELCTLVYPQKYGKPDPSARGMTGPKNAKGETTWGGLAEEVRYWGNWVLTKVKAEIGDLYPLIPDPAHKGKRQTIQTDWLREHTPDSVPPGYLMPVAYLWTRTVTCKNPNCKATVPLVRQTWLCKKQGYYVALKMVAPKGKKQVRFEVAEAPSENALGFDPMAGSTGGNAACLFCSTVADIDYVKAEGCAGRMSTQMMAVVCQRTTRQDKVYINSDVLEHSPEKVMSLCCDYLENSKSTDDIFLPDEKLLGKLSDQLPQFGYTTFMQVMNARQQVTMLCLARASRQAYSDAIKYGNGIEQSKAIATFLALAVDKMALRHNTQCTWATTSAGGRLTQAFGRQALEMVWDFAEANPFSNASGSWNLAVEDTAIHAEYLQNIEGVADVRRGNASVQQFPSESFDTVITDPPYYDNIQYSDLSDFFFVWLKRTVGHLYREHFGSQHTPKIAEAVASPWRAGNRQQAYANYETAMAKAFSHAYAVLKPMSTMVVVYAHKTTAGWATLVDSLRLAGFEVREAWPLDTELTGHLKAGVAALASSIFLIARKRDGAATGNYEEAVKPELEQIVRERVGTLWEMGISGADLVIACVGAGLRAFTRFTRVEYANGEEVPAERFLAEVETVVLETILARLSKEVGGNGGKYSLAGLDPATRFYILWRYTYRAADLDAGEAIIFANGTHVELDGPHGLSTGSHNLIEKKKGKYRLLDFSERGEDKHLGMPADDGQPAPLVDALHRTLWLLEKRPTQLSEFLRESQVNREQLRLVAQALAGPALKGGELADVSPSAELSVLAKLMANWQSVVEDAALTVAEKEDRKTGQKRFNM